MKFINMTCITTLGFLLVACGDTPRKLQPLEDVVLVPKADKVSIPSATLEPCGPFPKFEDRAYSEVEVLQYMKGPLKVYQDCKLRKADEDATVKKAFNIQEPSAQPSK